MGSTNSEVEHKQDADQVLTEENELIGTFTESLKHQNILRTTKKVIQPIGLVHGMQSACHALRKKVSDKSRSVITDISLCDCEAASAPTESMLQQHPELCASASSNNQVPQK